MASPSPDVDEQRTSAEARKNIRVAWLFPSLARAYYWQPVFKHFAARFPRTAIFTSLWPGFLPGYEGAFDVQILPGLGYVDLKKQVADSRRGFIWTPPAILGKLWAFDPQVTFSTGFSGWTVCALLLKLLRRSRVIIYWEGCSAQSIGSTRLKRALRRCIACFADAAVSNSEEGTAYLRNVLKMPPHKLLCHPFQVPELSLLDGAAENHSAGKRPVFLYVGSISPRKGWNYLLEATRTLVGRGIRNFSVLFAGAGEQDDELCAAIKASDLGDIVQHVGAVPYQQLGSYYRSADVFVSPTRADTWGVAVLEAMAFGKAVLCSRYAGSRQMITPGENGFIFDPFKPAQLADYMSRFVQDQALAMQFGARSLEKIAPYTPERAAGVLADLAFETTERKRRQTPLKFSPDGELVSGA